MFIPEYIVPEDMFQAYNLKSNTHNNKMFMRIEKGLNGMKEAGALANKELREHLTKYGYHLKKYTTGLWKLNTNKALFTLVVDDFGFKCVSKENSIHLINALKDNHKELDAN